jgi:Flp pilus assembly protein TadB
MLNEDDRRALSLIEQGLCSDDRRLADTFRTAAPGSTRGRRWVRRALVGFGTFLMVIGIVAAAGGVFLQGLLVFGCGIGWVLLRRRAAARKTRSAQPDGPHRDAPPEWRRSF